MCVSLGERVSECEFVSGYVCLWLSVCEFDCVRMGVCVFECFCIVSVSVFLSLCL